MGLIAVEIEWWVFNKGKCHAFDPWVLFLLI